jgi:hypothetical protein
VNAGNESERDTGASPAPDRSRLSGADFIIPVLATGLVIYYSVSTLGMAWEAKVTGVVIGAILIPLCLAHVVRMAAAIGQGYGTFGLGDLVDASTFNLQRFGLVALVAVFIVTLEWVGTTLGLFLLLIGGMLVMGVRSVRTLVAVAGVTAAVVYLLLIYLLSSRLPRGPVEALVNSLIGG